MKKLYAHRRRRYVYYALLMIRVKGWEIQRHGPANFYNWCRKAQSCYLDRIAAGWIGCCDGVPGGNAIYNRKASF